MMDKVFVTIEKDYFDSLLKAVEELHKIYQSSEDQVFLMDHLSYMSMYTSVGRISVIKKDDAFTEMKRQIENSASAASSANAAILSLKSMKIPMFNFKAKTVEDLCKKQ